MGGIVSLPKKTVSGLKKVGTGIKGAFLGLWKQLKN
jgi:hypothetical protein